MALDIDRIQRNSRATARSHHVTGGQIAIHHAGEMFSWQFGEIEHATGRLVDAGSAIPVGSITKAFTATAAMALVSEGDLDLHARVAGYTPELATLSDELTLYHLLSHTSGLPSGNSPDGATSLRRQVRACCESVPVQPPGVGFSYSNAGYLLVAHLIEVVTGMSWHEAVDSFLLQPLGIVPAFVGARGAARRPVATGHCVNRATGRISPVEQVMAPAEAGCGALAMSALDLVAFGRLHADAKSSLVDRGHLEMMHTAVPNANAFGLADGWGLGLAIYGGETATWLGHDGTAEGTACHLRIQPDSGTVVALTTNASSGTQVWTQLLADLRVAGLTVSHHEPSVSALRRISPPPDCAGHYVNGDAVFSVVAVDDGGLRLFVDGNPAAHLTVHDGLVFSMDGGLGSGHSVRVGRFLSAPSGHVNGIQISGRVATRTQGTTAPLPAAGRSAALARKAFLR